MKSLTRTLRGSDTMVAASAPSYAIREYRMPAKVMHWVTAVLVICMFSSGVIATQLGGGAMADTLFSLHKLTGALTLILIVFRLIYRLVRALPESQNAPRHRPLLHWSLYGIALLVPLLGWAGISDFGSRELFPGFSLPPIWPEGLGYDTVLLQFHGYMAFGLLALVALHIGIAMQDYLTDVRSGQEARTNE
jgi:cytochrome b561